MKTLIIVRHAKSSWDDLSLADFDRPLNDRGKRDAPRMGKRLKEKDIPLDLMLTSPARRALSTCKKIADVMGYPEKNIKADKELYHASEEKTLRIIQKLPDHLNAVMIFGHNPGLTDFVNALLKENIDNVPTCGVVGSRLAIESWKDTDWGKGKLLFFDYPKQEKS